MIYGNPVGGTGLERTYILVDEDGNEVIAYLIDKDTELTANENDIRINKTAVTVDGMTEGQKIIPSYHTTEGYRLITAGSAFETHRLPESDKYDFTKLQAVISPFAESIDDSVAVDKVAINNGVYKVNSTDILATVIRDSEEKKINLGIVNESEKLYVMRYFTYKEIN